MNIKEIHGLGRSAWHGVRISIAHKLTAMLFLMLFAAAANIIFFNSVINDFHDTTGTVSIAGKLRLLSQKIELDIIQFTSGSEYTSAAVLSGIDEFNTVLEALISGGVVFGVTIRRVHDQHQTALDNVRTQWHAYRDEIIQMLTRDVDGASQSESAHVVNAWHGQLSQKSTSLLHASETMVDAIVKDMQHRQRVVTQHMYVALAAIVLSFLLALWFVRHRVAQPMALLYDGARRLSHGDYHMQVHYPASDEMGRLIGAFNGSAQHIGALVYDLECSNESLRRAEAMFRSVVENSGIGVYVMSRTRFLFVNQKMASMVGYERKVMLKDLRLQDIFVEDVLTQNKGNGSECVKDIGPEIRTLRRGRCQDGSMIELDVFESMMRLEGEDVRLCVALEVTQRREDESSMCNRYHRALPTNKDFLWH